MLDSRRLHGPPVHRRLLRGRRVGQDDRRAVRSLVGTAGCVPRRRDVGRQGRLRALVLASGRHVARGNGRCCLVPRLADPGTCRRHVSTLPGNGSHGRLRWGGCDDIRRACVVRRRCDDLVRRDDSAMACGRSGRMVPTRPIGVWPPAGRLGRGGLTTTHLARRVRDGHHAGDPGRLEHRRDPGPDSCLGLGRALDESREVAGAHGCTAVR